MQWKALIYDKYEPRGLSCNSTLKICKDILKSEDILHKWGFGDSQSLSIVYTLKSTATQAIGQTFMKVGRVIRIWIYLNKSLFRSKHIKEENIEVSNG